MAKVIVLYHSQQFGDTKTLAETFAEGVREAGAEIEIFSTNERQSKEKVPGAWQRTYEKLK